MSEAEIRSELERHIPDAAVVERVMDMVADYARERASEEADNAVRDYEERM